MAKLTIVQWDITEQHTDIIVNAANKYLLWWGGVDWAIHKAAGPTVLEECKHIIKEHYLRWVSVGDSVFTTWGNLPVQFIIHTVGPRFADYKDDSRKKLLASCYVTSLKIAMYCNSKTIAFPSISTGIYWCPIEECSKIAVDTVRDFTQNNEGLDEVRFVLFSEKDYKIYEDLLKNN